MINTAELPPPVPYGSRVGVAALSGPVDPGRLEAGLAALRHLGFIPVLAENLNKNTGLFAGTDVERLEGFHRLAADPSLKAIVFARGGHGMLRVLPDIHWPTLARHPRAYVGYSDVTPFLMEVVRRLGLVAFHGPMVAGDFARGLSPAEEESFLGSLAGDFPRSLPVTGCSRPVAARGPLLGGCLSLLTATLGTAFATDYEGGILFWEEVSEPLYRLDRMLTHLRLSGSLDSISGMLIGHIVWEDDDAQVEPPVGEVGGEVASDGMSGDRESADQVSADQVSTDQVSTDCESAGCEAADEASGQDRSGGSQQQQESRLHRLTQESLGWAPWPIAWGLASGHESPNLTLPLGLIAQMAPGRNEVILGED